MTIAEAKVAARFNSEIYFRRHDLHGYVYSISWVHNKDQKPFVSVGCHDLKANSVYSAAPEDLTVTDWKAPDYIIKEAIEKEEQKKQ